MRVLTAAHYWPPHVGGVEFEAREQSRRLVARGHEVTVVSSRIADDRALSFDDGFPVHKVAASNVLEDRLRLPYPLYSPQLFTVMSRSRARRRRRRRAHAHLHEHDRRRARGAPAREAVRADPEQPVHRVPVPAQPRAADRRRHDRALHRRLGRPAGRDQRVHRATTCGASRRRGRSRSCTSAPTSSASRRSTREPRAEIRRRLGLPADAFVALTVRRLFYRNGLDTLLDAATRLRDRSTLHVVIGGSGPERGEIEGRIRRDGLAQRAPRRLHPRRRPARLLPRPPTCSCSRPARPKASASC